MKSYSVIALGLLVLVASTLVNPADAEKLDDLLKNFRGKVHIVLANSGFFEFYANWPIVDIKKYAFT